MRQASSLDFDDYVVARWPRLVRAALLLGCVSTAEAEDMVQTALVRCYLSWGRVTDAADRDAYVHKILINVFRKARRRRWSGEMTVAALPEANDPRADRLFADIDDRHAIGHALRALPESQAMVVVLRFYAQLDQQQTARALGISVGTVKSRLSRALNSLSQDPSLTDLRGAQ